MFVARPLRAVLRLAHQLVARTLEVYSGSSFNLLDYLGDCNDVALFCWIALTRVSLLFLMWFSRTIAPVLFGAPGNSFIFDTGEELYDDSRFAMVRQWDGVHMFFIAHYGYLYENQLVFFPGLPGVIRAVQYVTTVVAPVLHRLAPVSFYVCVLNVCASCVAGVVLRRLIMLTYLGPEAVLNTCWWRRRRPAATLARAAHAAAAVTTAEYNRVTESTICYRLLCGLTGTSLDADDPLAPLPATMKAARAAVRRRRRIVGGATLLWILTPAMVFTVAVYTESLFALTTILGVYWMAWYDPFPLAVRERIDACLSPTPVSPSARGERRADRRGDIASGDSAANSMTRRGEEDTVVPSLEELLSEPAGRASRGPRVVWRQALTTWSELGAVLLFTVAATFRSNAFTCAGFFIFPVVMQVLLPDVYARQCRTILSGQRATAVLAATPAAPAAATAAAAAPGGGETSPQCAAKAVGHLPPTPPSTPPPAPPARPCKAVVCHTLHCPDRRCPHPLRVLVVLVECALLLGPYLIINYVGYYRFVVPMWSPQAQARIGSAFWKLYPALQERYWNVGFLTAYTFTNLPNVVLALPVAVLVGICAYAYYLKPAWKLRTSSAEACGTQGAGQPSLRTRVSAALAPLIRSSNVVHLLALLTLALSKMHVQVTNRFVMACPALYVLLGAQLAVQPRSCLSQLILVWSILWSITGGILFANHLPWT